MLRPRRSSPRISADRLARRARRLGLDLPAPLVEALLQYYDLLAHWNTRINLTALASVDEAMERLLLEPLLAARYLPDRPGRLMDLGSGGGSPAVPLKLARPSMTLFMVESKTRKSAFLREVVRTLKLDDVDVLTSRFEELLTRPELHESMDWLSLRAIRVESKMLVGIQAFLRAGGSILWFRGAGGADLAGKIPPPLRWRVTMPLVDTLGSRLEVLEKLP
jgi:16S rRNA (guanine527-N7)-methyltransferase